MAMNFADKLISAIKNKGNGVCVGLDPRLAQLPNELTGNLNRDDSHAVANAFESFCIEVIEQVHNLVPIVKPQSAFFEALGPDGVEALAKVVAHARSRNLLVLMDAKRGDIGSTAEAYAHIVPYNKLTLSSSAVPPPSACVSHQCASAVKYSTSARHG